jgi:hypothetical protein
MCVAERIQVDHETLVRLVAPYQVPSLRDYETSVRAKSYNSDLRRSIHELQFHCTTNRAPTRNHYDLSYGESWDNIFDGFAEWPTQMLVNHEDCFQYLRSIDRHMTTVSLVDHGFIARVEEVSR